MTSLSDAFRQVAIKVTGLIFLTVICCHCSSTGVFWHTAVCTMYTSQTSPLCPISFHRQRKMIFSSTLMALCCLSNKNKTKIVNHTSNCGSKKIGCMLAFTYCSLHITQLKITTKSYSTIVLYSKDHKGVGVAHEIASPKNQPQFYLTAMR